MVRRSSYTSRGTTYWFQCFCITGIWFARAQIFATKVLTVIKEKRTKGSGVSEELDPRVYADFNMVAC